MRPNNLSVALQGVPYDLGASFLRGASAGPSAVRELLWSDAGNTWCESNIDLANRLVDIGDVSFEGVDDAMYSITQRSLAVLIEFDHVISVGGDHSISFPLLRAMREKHGIFDVLHIDAHPDLYDSFEGNRYSHACPFARVVEDGLVRRLVQVGIRTMNGHQREQANKFGVECFEMTNWQDFFDVRFDNPVYISLDLDAIDPGFAPGVSHPEPGGLSVREVLKLIHSVKAPIIGADVVELNPSLDIAKATARVAVKCIKEICGCIIRSR